MNAIVFIIVSVIVIVMVIVISISVMITYYVDTYAQELSKNSYFSKVGAGENVSRQTTSKRGDCDAPAYAFLI